MNHLIDQFHNQSLAITSIGLDGEAIDQITFLPKPRINVFPGMLVLTASETLKKATFEYEILQRLNIQTSIGQMFLLKVLSEGKVLLAGPSSIHDMTNAIQFANMHHPVHFLIDGAFSRQSSANVADGIIYCVGGGYSFDLDRIVRHAKQTLNLFSIQQAGEDYAFLREIEQIVYFTEDGVFHQIPISSLLEEHNLFQILPKNTSRVYLPYALTDPFAKEWMKRRKESSFDLILKSPASIILKDTTINQFIKYLEHVSVLTTFNVIAVCVNPTSPYRNPFDKDLMVLKLHEHIPLPILNVLEEGVRQDE